MLIAMIKLYNTCSTTNIIDIGEYTQAVGTQKWLFWAFIFSFAIKIPMWPVHTWLPDAHVEAPTEGSVLLAGVILKMGAYGLLRLVLPILPQACEQFAPIIIGLSLIGIIYTSIVALAQTDIKKLIAYSSIAHMGFVTLGIFTFLPQGLTGGIMQMISHGYVSAALFLAVGIIYDRYHSREIKDYSGLISIMPHYSFLFFMFLCANIAVPLTSGFVGEFLVSLAIFKKNIYCAILCTLGMILGAVYMLSIYKKMFMGKLDGIILTNNLPYRDIDWKEQINFYILVCAILMLGIYPKATLKKIDPIVIKLLKNYPSATNMGR